MVAASAKTLWRGGGSLHPGTSLLGEIIAWTANGTAIGHPDLIAALRSVDLDESVARELAPRHAFARACKRLSEQRIIRQVAEDSKIITFQFTAEQREGDHFRYELETSWVGSAARCTASQFRRALPMAIAASRKSLHRGWRR